MGGTWKHRKDAAAHKRARAAGLALLQPGTPCSRCGQPMDPVADRLDLDHGDDGTYLGFSHSRCNQAAGGRQAALAAGKRLRQRPCCVCGKPFTASRSSDGAKAVSCGSRACLTALRRSRKARQPDPKPPPSSGRSW